MKENAGTQDFRLEQMFGVKKRTISSKNATS